MANGEPTITRLPACAADSLCVVDNLTGSRAATLAMLREGRLIGGLGPEPAMMAAQSGGMALPGGAGRLGGALPRGAVRIPGGGIWTANQVMQWIQATAERAQVEAAIAQFNLDRGSAADLLAAHAYVWARNMLPMNARYWNKVPFSGPVNQKVAEAIMRHERAHPGTVVAATRGDQAALTALDAVVDAATPAAVPQGPAVVERTSAVFPALSTNSTRARTLVGIMGNQRWQAHHLIPFATVARLPVPVQQAIAASGWRMDSLVNLIALPANLMTYLLPPNLSTYPYHSGSHSRYDGDVWNALQPVAATAALMTPVALKSEMEAIDMRFRIALRTNPLYQPRLN